MGRVPSYGNGSGITSHTPLDANMKIEDSAAHAKKIA
jgi:hypothetical protein